MAFGMIRGLPRLSPQIRNVGFQQIRKNSTQEKVRACFFASIPVGMSCGVCVGVGSGFLISRNEFLREKTFSRKLDACLYALPLAVILGGSGALIGAFWPVTFPVIVVCCLTSKKKDLG